MVSVYARSNYRRCVSHCMGSRIINDEITLPAAALTTSSTMPTTATAAVIVAQNHYEPNFGDNRPLAWLPKHSVTRRTAKITREVQCLWKAKLGPAANIIPAEKVSSLFNDLQIFPTHAQVNEMLQCAQKCAGRNSAKYLTFAEFCIFATELKRSLHHRIPRRDCFIRLLSQNDGAVEKNKRTVRKMSTTGTVRMDVFLGGSCNPTTWRRDKAIPILEKHGVTYYNPQISEWNPSMIELEQQAKQNARVLLYVLDTMTRNVVSMIETANYLGNRRNVIIAMNMYESTAQVVGSEKVTSEEFNHLNASLCLLKQMTERLPITVFTTAQDAVEYAAEVIRDMNKTTEDAKNGHKLTKMKEAFETLDTEKCGLISSKDICKALRMLTQRRSQSAELKKNILQKIDGHNKSNNKNMKVNFEQFCKIVSELNLSYDAKYSSGNIERRINCANFFRSLSTPDEKPTFIEENGFYSTAIYLGGDCDQLSHWRQNVAIPMVRNACLTFYNPENERTIDEKLSSSEFAAISNSNVKLFVIPNTSRSLFTMILASYYIGVGADVVLCIQFLPDNCAIGSDELSPAAIKDYNRGRYYLTDIAKRENVPIFESITDAVQAAIDKCIK